MDAKALGRGFAVGIKAILKIGAPLFVVVALGLALYGSLMPDPAHIAALNVSSGEVSVLIGVAGDQRSYMIVPRDAAIHVVTDTPQGGQLVRRTTGGFYLYLAVLLAALFATWRIWLTSDSDGPP